MACRALVVDNQPDIRRLLGIKLADAGFSVSLALTAHEAWDKVLAEKPALVVLGSIGPAPDSGLIAHDIKARLDGRAPIILQLSAAGQLADIAAGLQSGADDYLVTPFSPRNLLERISVAFARAGRAAELPDPLQASARAERAQRPSGPRTA